MNTTAILDTAPLDRTVATGPPSRLPLRLPQHHRGDTMVMFLLSSVEMVSN